MYCLVQDMDALYVVPGDMVLLAAGSSIPADCYVNEGEIEVDQSAMTGESLPVKFQRYVHTSNQPLKQSFMTRGRLPFKLPEIVNSLHRELKQVVMTGEKHPVKHQGSVHPSPVTCSYPPILRRKTCYCRSFVRVDLSCMWILCVFRSFVFVDSLCV